MDRALGRRSFCAALLAASSAAALGRTPQGGVVRLTLPLPLSGLDPHALDDRFAALFGSALTDPLYALDAAGRPYPTLALALPDVTAAGTRVRLRPGLTSAAGKLLDARDAAFSLQRASKLGGAGVLAPFAPAKVSDDRSSLLFAGAAPEALAIALASPVTALVPRAFSRLAPDGTGAFAARLQTDRVTLHRNPRAARGAAFLERLELSPAPGLADALRAFEAGRSDVGWLGAGLYRARAGAKPFNGPSYGWVVLRTGADAKSWGASGIAQQLCDALPAQQLAHLGVTLEPGSASGVPWGGGPAELLVPSDDPHLLQLGSALAPLLSRPQNAVTSTPTARADFQARRTSKRYALMLDFVRNLGTSGDATLMALLTAADPLLARRPPRLGNQTAREIARTLPLGIVGALRVSGAHAGEIQNLESWNLGGVWWKTPKR